jgi:TolB-like protein/class 3 adenylate cyclase/Flp pilus assembly protein TadD
MSQELRQERKLVAIMFTDMVGYSAMVQRDESLALDLLEEHRVLLRSLFPQYAGREIEVVGDSFFVEFQSALDAIRCGIEIQSLLHERNITTEPEKRIRLRIGIHLGDVVYRGPNMLGDGVNIAARLEPLAQPEGICISEDVARQVRNKIDLPIRALEKRALKNIQLAVGVFEIQFPWSAAARTDSSAASAPTRSGRSAFAHVRWIAVLLILLLVALAVSPFLPSLRDASGGNKTIAVLPFNNLSGRPEDEYFSDGMTDDLLTQLGKISSLRVISRTTMMQYKGTKKTVVEIGHEINAGVILEGSVRRDGNQVRITAKLIDVSNDEYIWTDSYDKEFDQIFTIQRDVAREIANALRAKLSSSEEQRLARPPTDNLEAYDLYLKGRYFWNKRLPDKLKVGIEHFQQAIAKDSGYALAYAGLADSYTILGNFNLLPPDETYPQAKAAALKALEFDENLAEAHASLGFAVMSYDWDWMRAEKELQRAIALNPNYATARSWYALLLTVTGRFDEAGSVRRKALELDPLSPVINSDIGLTLYFGRKYDDAITQFKKTLDIDPTFALAYIPLGGAYAQKKMFKEAIDAYQKFTIGLALAHLSHPIPLAGLGYVYAVSGRKDDAMNMLELLEEMSKEGRYVAPYWLSILYMGLGEREKAFDWLERAYAGRDGSMIFLPVDPIFDSVRSHPRYGGVMRRLHLGHD